MAKADRQRYLRPLPDDFADVIALVEERLVCGGEQGVLKQEAVLATLLPQGGERLALVSHHHPDASVRHTHTSAIMTKYRVFCFFNIFDTFVQTKRGGCGLK